MITKRFLVESYCQLDDEVYTLVQRVDELEKKINKLSKCKCSKSEKAIKQPRDKSGKFSKDK